MGKKIFLTEQENIAAAICYHYERQDNWANWEKLAIKSISNHLLQFINKTGVKGMALVHDAKAISRVLPTTMFRFLCTTRLDFVMSYEPRLKKFFLCKYDIKIRWIRPRVWQLQPWFSLTIPRIGPYRHLVIILDIVP